jgi:hypothetical protein
MQISSGYQDKRIESRHPLYGTFTVFISGKSVLLANAQGIEAVSFFAAGKKDTSVKPGFRREAPEMRPKQGYKFLCVYPERLHCRGGQHFFPMY